VAALASRLPARLIVELRLLDELVGTVAGRNEPEQLTVLPGRALVELHPVESVTLIATVPDAVLLPELVSTALNPPSALPVVWDKPSRAAAAITTAALGRTRPRS
jgi:hypothetical protein